jgi:hypothetical protein
MDDDDDVYYMEYDEHGEPLKSVYQLSDLPIVNDGDNEDNICQLDDDGEEYDEENGGDDCVEVCNVYHLEEGGGDLVRESHTAVTVKRLILGRKKAVVAWFVDAQSRG